MRAKKWFPPLADIFVWIHGIITSSSRKYHCATTKGDIHVPAVWYTFNTATIRTSSSWLIFINQFHNFDLGIGNKTVRSALLQIDDHVQYPFFRSPRSLSATRRLALYIHVRWIPMHIPETQPKKISELQTSHVCRPFNWQRNHHVYSIVLLHLVLSEIYFSNNSLSSFLIRILGITMLSQICCKTSMPLNNTWWMLLLTDVITW